jgi:Polyketide cyclase / dehydrase and lipid transport
VASLADSVQVDAPAAIAWAFVSDPQRMYGLQPNTTVRLLTGAWDRPGSRLLVTTRAMGQTLDATHELVRFEPPRMIETRTSSQGTVSISLLQVEPVRDDACVLVIQGETEWGGSFFAFVSRILTGVLGRRGLEGALRQMKEAIEADAARLAADTGPSDTEPDLHEER